MEMQEKKTTTKKEALNLYQKINAIRCELQNLKIKKGGKNTFANFTYYTLDDLLPHINELESKYNVFSNFSLTNEGGTLTILNCENTQEQVIFTTPIAEAQIKGTTPIQSLGGVHTYLKRYLILNAYEIAEPEMFDGLVGTEKLVEKNYQNQKSYTTPYQAPQPTQDLIPDENGWITVSYGEFRNYYDNANYEKSVYDPKTKTIKVRKIA